MPPNCWTRPPTVGNDGQKVGRRLARLRALAVLLPLFACLWPAGQSRAAYPIGDVVLALPVPEDSQPALLYSLIERSARRYAAAPIILHSVPGRGGSYAWSFLKDKPGNGSALAALHFPSAVLLAADKNRAFSPDDIAPVAVFAYAANALWVAEDSPIRTLDDLTAYAREPGNTFVVAGTGRYTDHHMANLIHNRAAGIKSLYLPLTGTAESVAAVTEKRATACWGYALAPSTMPGLRPLAVAAPERCPALPDTPTFREQNMEVISGQYFGLAAPAESKERTREEVAAFFLKAFSNPELLDEVEAAGFVPEPVGLRDMPIFVGRQRLAVENFLNDYSMFPPRGTLPLWSPDKDGGDDAGR